MHNIEHGSQEPEDSWRKLKGQFERGELVMGRVTGYRNDGLLVDVAGVQGFVPFSQLLNFRHEEVTSSGLQRDEESRYERMKQRTLQLKIVELNREHKILRLSELLAVQQWRLQRREELLEELKPGDVRRGVVSNIANFGAFVDLGGADGLLHITQLSWSHVNHPSEVLKVGQEVEVQVLSVDKDKKKIGLTLKRSSQEPWLTAEQRYKAGQIVPGVITRIAPFGAFARIEEGIEGLIHLSELPPATTLEQGLHEGQQLQLRILRIDAERRRLSLSLRLSQENETVCPSCLGAVQPHWKHCMYCGASLNKNCPQCGTPYVALEGAQFCAECGTPRQESRPISQKIIADITASMGQGAFIAGQRVRILTGPFTQLVGTVKHYHPDQDELTIQLLYSGQLLEVRLQPWQVEKI